VKLNTTLYIPPTLHIAVYLLLYTYPYSLRYTNYSLCTYYSTHPHIPTTVHIPIFSTLHQLLSMYPLLYSSTYTYYCTHTHILYSTNHTHVHVCSREYGYMYIPTTLTTLYVPPTLHVPIYLLLYTYPYSLLYKPYIHVCSREYGYMYTNTPLTTLHIPTHSHIPNTIQIPICSTLQILHMHNIGGGA